MFGMFLKRNVSQRKFGDWIPGLIFAVLAFATGLLVLLLPETLNRPLPETVKEVESWTRSIAPAPATHPPAADTGHRPPTHDEQHIKSTEM